MIVVFNSLFSQTFVEAMQSHLALVTGVVDTSLEASLPEIQRWFNQLHTEVKTGNKTVCKKVVGLGAAFEQSRIHDLQGWSWQRILQRWRFGWLVVLHHDCRLVDGVL